MREILLFISLAFCGVLWAQPANDECVNAIMLPNQLEFCSEPGVFTTVDATASMTDYPACIREEPEIQDVWYSFVAQATDVTISVTGEQFVDSGGTLNRPQFVLYEGSCGALTENGCASVLSTNTVFGTFTELEVGQTYFINMGARFGNEGSFQMCLTQNFGVPEPSADCETGVILCDKSAFTVDFLSGRGSVADDISNTLCQEDVCAGGGVDEANSVWYKWTCDDPGTLTFNIDPLGPADDDIDFLVYELPNGLDDCNAKENIRCMLSGASQGNTDPMNLPCFNNTGLSETDNDALEECGCQIGNNNFAQAITMVSGRSYALVIMNFSNSGSGFNISWGGSGTFLGPTANFTNDLGQACLNQPVTFTDNTSSLDPIVSQEWNFGPNATPMTASGPGPHTVVFNLPGNQSIFHRVETSRGCLVTEVQDNLEIICCDENFDVSADASTLLCPNDSSGMIDLTASVNFTGAPPLTYLWSTGATTQDVMNLPSGDYDVTIFAGGTCEITQTFTIGGPPNFALASDIVMPTCDGGTDGVLTVDASGGTASYEYSFEGGAFSANNVFNNLPNGIYNVAVRDANNCEFDQDIVVNELILELDPDAITLVEPRCTGEDNASIGIVLNNGLGPFMYDFNLGGGLQSSSVLDNIGAGTYQVDVIDANRCRGQFVFDVEDPPLIEPNIDADYISCFGQDDGIVNTSVTGGRPGYTYSWSTGSNDTLITNLGPGTYTVTITDSGGCPAIIDTFIVEPNEIFAGIGQLLDNVCFGASGGSAIITASGGTAPYEFSANGDVFQINDTLNDLLAGDYNFIVMDAEGCMDTIMGSIDEPAEFIIDPGQDLLVNLGFDTTLNAVANYSPVTYTWAGDTVRCLNVDCSRVLVSPVMTTNYVVTGTNSQGCLATADVTVIVVNDKPVYIPNSFSPNGDGVNDGFTLFSGPAVNRIEQLQVFDRWGGMVYQSKTDFLPNETSLGWDGTHNGKPVNSGVFVYQFVVEFQNGDLEEYAGDVTVVR